MKIYLSQPEIDAMIQELANQIQISGYRPARVVGIANGGLPVSKPLAELLDLPHEQVRISHYDGQTLRVTPIIEGSLSHPVNNLIVDDLIDAGWTHNTFDKHFGLKGNRIAVLFRNVNGPEPDFYVQEKSDAWLVFPWNEDWKECELKKT